MDPVAVVVLCVFLGKHGSPITPVIVGEGIMDVNLYIHGGVAIRVHQPSSSSRPSELWQGWAGQLLLFFLISCPPTFHFLPYSLEFSTPPRLHTPPSPLSLSFLSWEKSSPPPPSASPPLIPWLFHASYSSTYFCLYLPPPAIFSIS